MESMEAEWDETRAHERHPYKSRRNGCDAPLPLVPPAVEQWAPLGAGLHSLCCLHHLAHKKGQEEYGDGGRRQRFNGSPGSGDLTMVHPDMVSWNMDNLFFLLGTPPMVHSPSHGRRGDWSGIRCAGGSGLSFSALVLFALFDSYMGGGAVEPGHLSSLYQSSSGGQPFGDVVEARLQSGSLAYLSLRENASAKKTGTVNDFFIKKNHAIICYTFFKDRALNIALFPHMPCSL